MKLWSLKDLACLRTFEGHAASVLKVVFLGAGTHLATAGGDGLLKARRHRALRPPTNQPRSAR